jgi:hypothetical protein
MGPLPFSSIDVKYRVGDHTDEAFKTLLFKIRSNAVHPGSGAHAPCT